MAVTFSRERLDIPSLVIKMAMKTDKPILKISFARARKTDSNNILFSLCGSVFFPNCPHACFPQIWMRCCWSSMRTFGWRRLGLRCTGWNLYNDNTLRCKGMSVYETFQHVGQDMCSRTTCSSRSVFERRASLCCDRLKIMDHVIQRQDLNNIRSQILG